MVSKTKIQPFIIGRLESVYGDWFYQPDEEDRKYVVQGKKATKNEYNVAAALEILELDYIFQLSIAGGRMFAFGIVLDFLVMTVPLPTPIWVHSEYWHRGERRAEDIRQQQTVEDFMEGQINPSIEIWADESETVEQALSTLRRVLGY